jgi:hypothetical protein
VYQSKDDNSFDVFRKTIGKRTRAEQAKYTFSHTEESRPASAIPATARQAGNAVFLTGTGHLSVSNDQRIHTQPWIFDDVTFPPNLGKMDTVEII